MENNRNLIIAVVLSVILMMGFNYFYEQPAQERYRQQLAAAKKQAQAAKPASAPGQQNVPLHDRATAVAADRRIPINSPQFKGSVDLKGGRIDDLTLIKYRESVDPASPTIVLLSPAGSAPPDTAYFTEFSWLAADPSVLVPTEETVWNAGGEELSPGHPLMLSWDNGQGLSFRRTIAVDDQFMFTITDDVHNAAASAATLYPFGLVRRQEEPPAPAPNDKQSASKMASYGFVGPLGVLGGTLQDFAYKDVASAGKTAGESDGGWLGFTDKYWLTALIPPPNEKLSFEFTYTKAPVPGAAGLFQADFRGAAVTVAANASAEHVIHFFAGAKPLTLLDRYAAQYNIPHFDRAIDFGRFFWIAEPFLYLLDYLAAFLGSFALAILALTVMLKLVTLPLSIKSYRSMAKMKALQPELKRLQERFADDKAKQGAEVLELYKREKVNPMSGCFPILIQLPIFFALYKVLYVGIEMRQAPFYGWVKDMSIPDPSSLVTLFGLVPAMGPAFHHMIESLAALPPVFNLFGALPGLLLTVGSIGAWPIFMGLSMFLQQKLSPQPPDKTQARVFMFMPIIFAFTMGQMPAGLVIYWSWSNLLSIGQQWYVMRHTGGLKKT